MISIDFYLFLYHLVFIGISLILVQALSLMWSVQLFSLGNYAFYAIGAYCVILIGNFIDINAIQNNHFIVKLLVFFLMCLVGMAVTALIAFFFNQAFPALRGDYLAIASLSFGEITRITLNQVTYFGGSLGAEIPYLFINKNLDTKFQYVLLYFIFVLIFNIFLFWIIKKIKISIFGQYINTIKTNEFISEHIGINTSRVVKYTFIFSAGLTGLAGVVYCNFITIISPNDFNFISFLPILLFLILGGDSQKKTLIAVFTLYFSYELIKSRFYGLFSHTINAFLVNWQESFYAIILLSVVLLRTDKLKFSVSNLYRRIGK